MRPHKLILITTPKSNIGLLLDFLFALFELLNIDEFATSCINFFHLLNLRLELFLCAAHHLVLLLATNFLFEMGFQIVGYGHGVTHILTRHERPKHFLLPNDAVSECIELGRTIIYLLVHGFGLVDQVLAV